MHNTNASVVRTVDLCHKQQRSQSCNVNIPSVQRILMNEVRNEYRKSRFVYETSLITETDFCILQLKTKRETIRSNNTQTQ